jgi:hypothetical protein
MTPVLQSEHERGERPDRHAGRRNDGSAHRGRGTDSDAELGPAAQSRGLERARPGGSCQRERGEDRDAGADLTLPSGLATGDDLFSPNLNPAFFYSWDVHPEQQPDWFRVSARFTPSDFGIGDTRSYEVEWVVLPFFLDLGAELTLEASPDPGPGAGSSTLGEFGVRTLSMAVGPIEPNETLHADLIRNSRNGSWIWLRTNITYLPPTRAPM